MGYNPNGHKRRSMRLKGYDYSSEGMYYVTVCTYDRECTLGEVIDGEMRLNNVGEIVDRCWIEIPHHFANASWDIHQIPTKMCRGTIHDQPEGDIGNPETGVTPDWPLMKNTKGTLGKMIRSFKAEATKKIHDAGFSNFSWQREYHDHIVRDGKDLDRIRLYIFHNLMNWKRDGNIPGNIRMDRTHVGTNNSSPLD